MTPDAILSDCERLFDRGDTLGARRRLAQWPTTADVDSRVRLADLRRRIGTDWQVLVIGTATSLTILTAVLLSYV